MKTAGIFLTGAFLSAAFVVSAGSIYDDAVWHFEGGRDGWNGKAENGLVETGEVVDELRAGNPSHANHQGTVKGFATNCTWNTLAVPFQASGMATQNVSCISLSHSWKVEGGTTNFAFAGLLLPSIASYCTTNVYSAVIRVRRDQRNPFGTSEWLFNFGYSGNGETGQGWLFGVSASGTPNTHCTGSSSPGSTFADSTLENIPLDKWVDLGFVVTSNVVTYYQAFSGSDTTSVKDGPARIRWGRQTFSTASRPMPNTTMKADCIRVGVQDYVTDWKKFTGVDNGCKFFCGSYQRIAFWNRALSSNEVAEAFSYPRPGLLNLGAINGHADEFIAETSAESSFDAGSGLLNKNPWNTFRAAMACGDRRTVTFQVGADDATLAQLLVIKTVTGSADATFKVTLNGRVVASMLGVPSATKTVYPIRKLRNPYFQSGSNTLVLERVDANGGTATLDGLWIGGSWFVGRQNNGTGDMGWLYTKTYNTALDGHAMNRALNVATCQTETFMCRIAPPRDLPSSYQYRFKLRSNLTGASDDAELIAKVDGVECFRAGHPSDYTDYWVDLTPGEHEFTMKIQGTKGVYNFDCMAFTFEPPPAGTVLLLR